MHHANYNGIPRLSWPMRIACGIAHADSDLLAESNRLDRMTVAGQACILLFSFLFASGVWTLFFSGFKPVEQALAYGLIIGTAIFILDRWMVGSDWELAGILRTERPSAKFWGKVAIRIAVASVFSAVVATAGTMHLADDAISAEMQTMRLRANAVVEDDIVLRTQEAKTRIVKPVEDEVARLAAERDTARSRRDLALTRRDQATADVAKWKIEEGRELDGYPGHEPGAGPKYKDAQRQVAAANDRLKTALADFQRAAEAVQRADLALEAERQRVASANSSFRKEAERLQRDKVRDPRWRPDRNDSLMRFEALWALKRSPERGYVVTVFTGMASVFFLLIELIPLVCKFWFSHATVYTLRLRLRTLLESAELMAHFRQSIESVAASHPVGRLRIVGDNAGRRAGPAA